jgi:hypothetical protein
VASLRKQANLVGMVNNAVAVQINRGHFHHVKHFIKRPGAIFNKRVQIAHVIILRDGFAEH